MEESERRGGKPRPQRGVEAGTGRGMPLGTEDHWKVLFDQFDPGNTGYISTEAFRGLLQSRGSELEAHKLQVLLALADDSPQGRVCYQDFVNLMSNKRSSSFRRAVQRGKGRGGSDSLLEERGLSLGRRLVRHVAYETLPRHADRRWYYDTYTCCPPPWFIITITLLEASSHAVAAEAGHSAHRDRSAIHSWLTYDPRVVNLWNSLPQKVVSGYIYYGQGTGLCRCDPIVRGAARAPATHTAGIAWLGFVHVVEQLGFSVTLQLLVGVPLEMVHGALRIGFIYVTGALAGSLATSVADMTAPAFGSSGGVYALVSAHLANVAMNWSGMRCQFKLFRMGIAMICMSLEFGRAVWLRFRPPAHPSCAHPSFACHLGGVMVGITLGVVILKNYEQKLHEQSLWWIFVIVYLIFVSFAVLWNIFAYGLLDSRLLPPV
ncbi:rhomboid-related protein 3-like [Leucoraja erinacea]|uniref:rhomboid-related protein 3-like n=1 Tax=Leucoraja erinaceus TaxID=7782 RepID=UPI0024546B87|nr:rhomboid-related protein 3-like [Leucoraja erinacea]